mgnify:CR=1 FL=1
MDILLLALRVTLAVLLYVFLGAVLWMLWRDLRGSTNERSVTRPKGRLVMLKTVPDQPEDLGTGTVFPLQPVTSIGRSPNNTIVITDTYASSQHALLTWREGHWWVRDQDSRNGTMLNGESVTKPMVVSTGDVITVGETELKLEVEDP